MLAYLTYLSILYLNFGEIISFVCDTQASQHVIINQ